ncbi:unnamed protein product [Clonostachys solani]|uniref:Transcription factor domain-containing protein n=1 Tax=Clonostachys solani TaxID=160281 RepID=A0A9N9ZLX1_9HYPO|nr:unnamed protein product [Clonostachys solani]
MESIDRLGPSGPSSSGRQQTDGSGRLKLRVCDHCRVSDTDSSCAFRKKIKCPPKRLVNTAALATSSAPSMDYDQQEAVDPASVLDSELTGNDQFLEALFQGDDGSWAEGLLGSEVAGGANVTMPFTNTSTPSLPRHISSKTVGGAYAPTYLSPEAEEFLLELYIHHVQPVYPLLRFSASSSGRYGLSRMSPRLRMSIYAVASRYASSQHQEWLLSPDYFAMRAEHHANATKLTIDELKASILLCLHKIGSAVTWDAVAEMARITRMAELYYRIIADQDKGSRGSRCEYEAEELRTVWWCIYSLDTCFSAIAIMSHAMADHAQGNMTLPVSPVPDLTKPPGSEQRRLEHIGDSELVLAPDLKLWETMTMVFSKSPCRGRSLYIGACTLMRSVTELRFSVKQGCGPAWKARFQELESDCAATTLSLPAWVFKPTRNLGIGETETEHRDRLETLIVWQGACLLHATLAVQLDGTGAASTESAFQGQWQTVVARANEVLHVVQNWKPDYFEAIDSKSAYIILLTGVVLTLDGAIHSVATSCGARSSHHMDLLFLFLGQIGRYWLLDVLKKYWANPPLCHSHKSAFDNLSGIVLDRQIRFSAANLARSGGPPDSMDLLLLSEITTEVEESSQDERSRECWSNNELELAWDLSGTIPGEVGSSLDWDSVLT